MFDLNRRRNAHDERPGAPPDRRRSGTRGRTLCLPADEQALARVRPCLEAALTHAKWEDAARYDILVAAGEAIVNAVTHGSLPGTSVGVVFSVSPWLVRVSVVDRGPGRDAPLAWPPACPEPDSLHGRGLVMIAALSSRVEVGASGQGTRITMEFEREAVRARLAA